VRREASLANSSTSNVTVDQVTLKIKRSITHATLRVLQERNQYFNFLLLLFCSHMLLFYDSDFLSLCSIFSEFITGLFFFD